MRYQHGDPVTVTTRGATKTIAIRCPACKRKEPTMFWHETAGRRLCSRCWRSTPR